MKVTKSYIKQLVKEELSRVLKEENSSTLDNLLKSWAQKRAKADDSASERPGMYDVNGGKAVFSHVDGYLYYGSARDERWEEILKAVDPLALQQSMINVNAPIEAEGPSLFRQ